MKNNRIGLPTPLIVWTLRLVVGAVFIVSGFSKAIDPWGSMLKIEEYFTVWGFDAPRSLVLMIATLLSTWEGLAGVMLLLGCYRRSIVVLLLLTMGVMLPLSAWIAVADPVSECGCFGDFIILSNNQTLVKNIILTALLVVLLFLNKRVRPLIAPMVQWIAGALVTITLLLITLAGYQRQPLVDFRQWPVGSRLVSEPSDEDDDILFIYERGGERQQFTGANLPDSSWTFVDRAEKPSTREGGLDADPFAIYDGEEDVTADVLDDEEPQLIALIPDTRRADISYTYYLNALNRKMEGIGSMFAVVAADSLQLERWRDLSGARYAIYTADASQIRTLARGDIALVYLRDGKIIWKRSAPGGEYMLNVLEHNGPEALAPNPHTFQLLILALAISLIFIIFADTIRRLLKKYYKSSTTICHEKENRSRKLENEHHPR